MEFVKGLHSILAYNLFMYGKIIRELRKERNLSQKQLAEKLNTAQNTVSKYETETLDLSTDMLIKICDFFDVPADYILGRIDYY